MDCDLLNEIDLPEAPFSHYYNKSGQEHYRLLRHLCEDKKVVVDVGTYWGLSALAMSSADKVYTFDVKDQRRIDLPKNVEFSLEPSLNHTDKLLSAEIILLDTYHNGGYEQVFYETLIEIGYKGVLILDDIYLNDPMKKFWSSIDKLKEDVTHLGHYTGTGIVYFK